jgi:cbb3-type cytochrome c oxidase subunit III
MNKVVTGLILYLVGFAVFHFGLFQQVILQMEEPGMLLNRYTYFLSFVAYCIAFNLVLKLKPPIALNGLIVWLLGLYFYKAVLFPPIPWTLLITYMMLWTIGTFLYISQDPKTFAEFRSPIVKTVIGEYKMARIIVFIALPLLVGFGTYKSLEPSFAEPVELRTVHPAPPATTKVHGKSYTLEGLQNPFRVDEQDNYVDGGPGGGALPYEGKFPFLDADKHEYMKSITEGGTIFFQNCHYCHGDQLNGLGMFSHVFNPTPANFIDPGTIAMLRESFLFWRVSKGGPGLPNESTPWSSAMPPWEEHLKTEEIWKVILFEYWYTGWHPRTFDEESSSGGGE